MLNYTEQFKHFIIQSQANWLRALRQNAFGYFTEVGFPTTHDEAWKYTRTAPIENKNFSMAPHQKHTISAQDITSYCVSADYYQAIFVNGYFSPEFSSLPKKENGLIIQSITDALQNSSELVQQHLKQHIQHGYAALNTAFFQDGLFIYLPENVQLDKPLHLLFFVPSQNENLAFSIRNVIVADKNSHISLIEHYVGSATTPYLTNTITDIYCGSHASVHHHKIQQEGLHSYHIGATHVQQASNSEFKTSVFSFGGSLVRSDTDINLDKHSLCTLDGLFFARNRQHMDFHTNINHENPGAQSREFYKGIIADQARGVFHGKVVVHKNAQKSDAQQQSKNLLLSDLAEIDTKPELEIYADDVKCSHGATVGQLEETSLFYLRSRGLDLEDAKQMLIYAFAREIVDRVDDKPLKAYLGKII